MPSKQPFKRHRFPAAVILCAFRMYLRYPLSYQDVADLLAERGLDIDRSTVYRWVQKFGPELSRRTEKYLKRGSLDWHVPFRDMARNALPGNGRNLHSSWWKVAIPVARD